MSGTEANSQHYKVGIVTEVHGESLYATNPKGVVRQLSIGSNVYSDDKIESHEGSSMVVQTSNGQSINIPDDVYDQMLSNELTKELSKSLNSLQESQEDSRADPTSQNQNAAQHTALNTEEATENTLKLSDLLSEDTFGSLSNHYDCALLSPQMIDYPADTLEDYSHLLFAG